MTVCFVPDRLYRILLLLPSPLAVRSINDSTLRADKSSKAQDLRPAVNSMPETGKGKIVSYSLQ